MEVQRVNGSATRREAKEFWSMVQDRNAAKPPSRQILPDTSCRNCGSYRDKAGYCVLKKKRVKRYNICEKWSGR